MACLRQQGLAHASIGTYLSGVHELQIAYCFADPAINQILRLNQILKGVKMECGKEGKSSRSQLPITPSILRNLVPIHHSREWANKYDPNTHFSFADIALDNYNPVSPRHFPQYQVADIALDNYNPVSPPSFLAILSAPRLM